jgi:hypothetical protein
VNTTHSTTASATDWHAIVVLGLVMSVLAALAAMLLVEAIGATPVIVGVVVVASIAGWVVSGRRRPTAI